MIASNPIRTGCADGARRGGHPRDLDQTNGHLNAFLKRAILMGYVKTRQAPLFQCYLFVRLDPEIERRRAINFGVVRPLSNGETPCPDRLVEEIMKRRDGSPHSCATAAPPRRWENRQGRSWTVR